MILKPENDKVISLIKNVFKEANKQSTNIETSYKITSLRCLSDILQYSASNSLDSDFDLFWSMFVEKYFIQELTDLKDAEEKKKQESEIKESSEINDENKPIEEIKKLKLSESNKSNDSEIDEASQELNDNYKFTILATIGKSWPYSNEMQGL